MDQPENDFENYIEQMVIDHLDLVTKYKDLQEKHAVLQSLFKRILDVLTKFKHRYCSHIEKGISYDNNDD